MPSGRVMPSRASRMRRPARTARSGSSSCTAGTPKTPTTASPMNFSTVPPWDSITLRGAGEVLAEQGVDVLGVGGLAHGGEGDEVAEEGGDGLALLGDGGGATRAWSRTWSRRRSRRGLRSRSWGRRSSPSPVRAARPLAPATASDRPPRSCLRLLYSRAPASRRVDGGESSGLVPARARPCAAVPRSLVGRMSAVLPIRKFRARARTTGNRQMQGSCWRRRAESNR